MGLNTVGILTHGINIVRDMMMGNTYKILPIHDRPDLLMDCIKLINSEWPSSDTRRLRTLNMSCDNFPTCLVLLNNDKVIGHSKISLLHNLIDCCYIESVVIDINCRCKGLGSMLLNGTENYAMNKGIKHLYLSTKGQEKFYEKNGYSICQPINIWDNRSVITPFVTSIQCNNIDNEIFNGPKPPPMPNNSPIIYTPNYTTKTFMVKKL